MTKTKQKNNSRLRHAEYYDAMQGTFDKLYADSIVLSELDWWVASQWGKYAHACNDMAKRPPKAVEANKRYEEALL